VGIAPTVAIAVPIYDPAVGDNTASQKASSTNTTLTRRISMASFNKITIVGYLGRDPEIRYTADGTAVCHFSVATTEKRKDPRTGEAQDATTWFRVTAWRRQAEVANQYLSKGKQVYVEGRLRQEEYTDRDGNRRTSLEVSATEIHFLGAKGDESGSASASQPIQGQSASRPAAGDEVDGPPDNDIPF
jgi:single-strand DNA-binding protein